MSHISVLETPGAFNSHENIRHWKVSKQIIHFSCEDGVEKSVPRDHRLLPNYYHQAGLFYPILTLMIDCYNIKIE